MLIVGMFWVEEVNVKWIIEGCNSLFE